MSTIKVKVARVSESGKSVMVAIPATGRGFGSELAFARLLPDEIGNVKKGDEIEIDANPELITRNNEDGELMTYKNGEPMLFIK